jgi:serine/threonine-protein kinase
MARIGKYQINNKIGHGSLGVVCEARDLDSNRDIAIKIINPAYTRIPGFSDNFLLYGRVASTLKHPNVMRLLEFGENNGKLFYTMESMAGGSLDDLIKNKGALPESEAYRILDNLIEGLLFLYSRGIFHSGLKPTNVLFDESGKVFIADVGTAGLLRSLEQDIDPTQQLSPHYLAPEIWGGKALTPAVDQFALGCLLYEMLTAQKLFDGDSPAQIRGMHQQPLQLSSSLSAKSKQIITRLVKYYPVERYPNLTALRAEFDTLVLDEDLFGTPIVPNLIEPEDRRDPTPQPKGDNLQPQVDDEDKSSMAVPSKWKKKRLAWLIPVSILLVLLTCGLIANQAGWFGNANKKSTATPTTTNTISASLNRDVTPTKTTAPSKTSTPTRTKTSTRTRTATTVASPTRQATTMAPTQVTPTTPRPQEATPRPTTAAPSTAMPTTPRPTTAVPSTAMPTTPSLPTAIPTTAVPTTPSLPTSIPTTALPTTPSLP